MEDCRRVSKTVADSFHNLRCQTDLRYKIDYAFAFLHDPVCTGEKYFRFAASSRSVEIVKMIAVLFREDTINCSFLLVAEFFFLKTFFILKERKTWNFSFPFSGRDHGKDTFTYRGNVISAHESCKRVEFLCEKVFTVDISQGTSDFFLTYGTVFGKLVIDTCNKARCFSVAEFHLDSVAEWIFWKWLSVTFRWFPVGEGLV